MGTQNQGVQAHPMVSLNCIHAGLWPTAGRMPLFGGAQ